MCEKRRVLLQSARLTPSPDWRAVQRERKLARSWFACCMQCRAKRHLPPASLLSLKLAACFLLETLGSMSSSGSECECTGMSGAARPASFRAPATTSESCFILTVVEWSRHSAWKPLLERVPRPQLPSQRQRPTNQNLLQERQLWLVDPSARTSPPFSCGLLIVRRRWSGRRC